MANIGVVPRNIFPSSTGYPIDITFSKTTWDSEGIPTTELKVSNTDEEKFEVIPYFQLLIRKDIVDELLPPGEYGNPAMYIQEALIDQSLTGRGVIAFRLRMIMKRSFFEEFFFDLNQGGSTYPLEDKRKELEDLDREWYLKDDWSYTGCNWNMGYEGYQAIPSATLDYDNGEGEYKTLFEWRFSADSMDILPQ